MCHLAWHRPLSTAWSTPGRESGTSPLRVGNSLKGRQVVDEVCWAVRGWKGYSELRQKREESGQGTALHSGKAPPPPEPSREKFPERLELCLWRGGGRAGRAKVSGGWTPVTSFVLSTPFPDCMSTLQGANYSALVGSHPPTHPSIHPTTHPSIQPSIHPFTTELTFLIYLYIKLCASILGWSQRDRHISPNMINTLR